MFKSSSMAILTQAQVHHTADHHGRLFRKARREERRAEQRAAGHRGAEPPDKRKSRSLPRVPKEDDNATATSGLTTTTTTLGSTRRGSLRYADEALSAVASSRLVVAAASSSSPSRRKHHRHPPDADHLQLTANYPPFYPQEQRRDKLAIPLLSSTRPALSRSATEMRLATSSRNKRTAEVPVLIDETTTKWINGVTGQTTCDDVIEAIVTRHAATGRRGKVRNLVPLAFATFLQEILQIGRI
jgi:hypothetical protein